ncbi:unnamed protein product [Cunninghamella blakesleeana]
MNIPFTLENSKVIDNLMITFSILIKFRGSNRRSSPNESTDYIPGVIIAEHDEIQINEEQVPVIPDDDLIEEKEKEVKDKVDVVNNEEEINDQLEQNVLLFYGKINYLQKLLSENVKLSESADNRRKKRSPFDNFVRGGQQLQEVPNLQIRSSVAQDIYSLDYYYLLDFYLVGRN